MDVDTIEGMAIGLAASPPSQKGYIKHGQKISDWDKYSCDIFKLLGVAISELRKRENQ